MAKKELTNQQLEDLIEEAVINPSITNNWSLETSVAVRSYMRKRGVLQKSDTWASFSIINWPERVMTRFYLLAVNAYIGRAIKEFELDGGSSQDLKILNDFFTDRLCFNAYKHVREGLDKDISKESLREELSFAKNDRVSSEESDSLTKEQKSILAGTRDSIRSAKNTIELALGQIPKRGSQADVLRRRIEELDNQSAKINSFLGNTNRAIEDALENIPPMDRVHGFNKFCADNWSQLRHLTCRVYDVPDNMETTIWFHGAANSLEKILKFQEKINKECTFGAEVIGNGAPTLIAPDLLPDEANQKFNGSDYARDMISKYIDRAERDNKIVHEIMNKNARRGRKKMILDDFKQNPDKKKAALDLRKSGKKQNAVTGVNEYNRLVGSFRPGNDKILNEEEERELIDEILDEDPNVQDILENSEKDERSMPADECLPIRILGDDGTGNMGEVDVHFAIPDSMSVEALTEKYNDEEKKKRLEERLK